MQDTLYARALVDSLDEALGSDERRNILGLYFLGLTEHRVMMVELRKKYPGRFYDPPIAEIGYVGTAIGSALAGMRPIVDCATASFMFEAFPQILNEAANIRYMSGGKVDVPMVLHFNAGIRGGGAAQHAHSPQAMFWNTPGLEIMVPSTPADVRGLVRTAMASDNPTLWVDHVKLFNTRGPVPDSDEAIPFGVADIKREGTDCTIFASSLTVLRALEAAEEPRLGRNRRGGDRPENTCAARRARNPRVRCQNGTPGGCRRVSSPVRCGGGDICHRRRARIR